MDNTHIYETDRWLSVEEIATHLGVSKETIYRWIERKRIPCVRIGKLWKFRRIDVDEWILQGGAASLSATRILGEGN
jgi:excisionase family DNA binding protein